MENNELVRRNRLSEEIQERVNFVNERILKVDSQEFSNTVQFVSLESKTKRISHDYLHQKTEEERVKLVKKLFNWVPPQPRRTEVLKKYQKNSETSKLLRDHGNNVFRQRNFREALHYYNVAVLFGLDESLSLAYANRAAVLLELGYPAGALQDIDLALRHNYPADQTHKLEERKLKCTQMLQKTASEDEPIKHLMEEERAELNKIRDSFGRIEKRNPRAPAAAEFVEIKFDETYGRQLVATRDVDAGTLLLLEDPYVCVLEAQLHWDTEHCHHCFKRIRRGIPCEKCVFAFYCGEACRQAALGSTHRIECSIMPYLHLSRIPDYGQSALKVICKVGSSELYRLFSSRDPAFFNRKSAFGTAPEDIYESDSYLSVFHLQSHPDRFSVAEQGIQIHEALLITDYLDTETDYFKTIPDTKKNEFKDFVAAMMVHHIQRRIVNSMSLIEMDELEDLTLKRYLRFAVKEPGRIMSSSGSRPPRTKQEFAGGAYPLLSLVNHSCAPNAFYMNHGSNGTMSLIASRRMKKGEQILIPYAYTFLTHSLTDRRARLHNYNFDCNCIACRNQWPIGISAASVRYCCQACSKDFCNEDKDSAEFLKCELKGPGWTCRRCRTQYNGAELQNRFVVNNNLSVQVQTQVQGGQHREGLRLSLKLIDYFQLNLMPPEGQTYLLGFFLANAIAFIMQVM